MTDALSKNLIKHEDDTVSIDEDVAIDLIELDPARFFQIIRDNEICVSEISPLHLKSAFEGVIGMAKAGKISSSHFIEHLIRGDYDAYMKPLYDSLEGGHYKEMIADLLERRSQFTGLETYVVLLQEKHDRRVKPTVLLRALNNKTELTFSAQSAERDGFNAKRYTSFLLSGRNSAGILMLAYEHPEIKAEDIPTKAKEFILASAMMLDIEKAIQGQPIERNDLFECFFKHEHDVASFNKALDLAYSLFAENIETSAGAELKNNLLELLKYKMSNLIKDYDMLYVESHFDHSARRIDNAWDKITTLSKDDSVVVLDDRSRRPEAPKSVSKTPKDKI